MVLRHEQDLSSSSSVAARISSVATGGASTRKITPR
jgi:hypothetical protein